MHHLPPLVECLAHLLDRLGRPGEPGQGGPLGDVVDVGGHVGLMVAGALDDVGRSHQPSDPPSGHGVGLGDSVDDQPAVLQLGHGCDRGRRRSPVDELLIDLVGQDPDPAFARPPADRLDLVGGIDGPGRIGGRHENQDFGAWRGRSLELVDSDPEACCFVGHAPGPVPLPRGPPPPDM